ncbi:hypothetical protein [Rhizobium mongolense]|nr:hypothetical protein [Rhizobium mongolense]MBB4233246.1 hypothetical protein [Rhizobium mongolense]
MAGAPGAQATNLLEQAITQTQPCRSLKGKLDLGLTKVDLGIDNIDGVEVETLRIAVDGDAAEVSARGTLACKTSDNATFKGGFKATMEAHVAANIASCAIEDSSLNIVKVEGKYGYLVSGFKDQIAAALRGGLEKNFRKLCGQ